MDKSKEQIQQALIDLKFAKERIERAIQEAEITQFWFDDEFLDEYPIKFDKS